MYLTLAEVIALTEGRLITSEKGQDEQVFSGVAALDEAAKDEVSFLGNEKYYQDFLKTSAGVVLIPPAVPEHPAGVTLIEVEDPSRAFGVIVKKMLTTQQKFEPGVDPGAHVAEGVKLDPEKVSIKAGAVIEAGASIGDGTEIGSGAVVCVDVVIGENCKLYANSTVRERCVLGSHVVLQPGAVIGSDGYGYTLVDGRHETIDQVGVVVLEDYVEVGANSTIDRARFGKTVIGEGSKIDNLVQIGHNVRIGKHCLVVAQSGLAGSTHVGDYATLAARSASAGHLKIGERAVLTAQAAALKDLPGDTIYMGVPARPIREEQKKRALTARLPKLVEQVKELQRRLDELES